MVMTRAQVVEPLIIGSKLLLIADGARFLPIDPPPEQSPQRSSASSTTPVNGSEERPT